MGNHKALPAADTSEIAAPAPGWLLLCPPQQSCFWQACIRHLARVLLMRVYDCLASDQAAPQKRGPAGMNRRQDAGGFCCPDSLSGCR